MSKPHGGQQPEDHLELITVFRRGGPAEVAVAKSVLQAAGIDFATKNEAVQDLFGWGRFPRGTNLFMGPIELQVRACDAGYARELLAGISGPGIADTDVGVDESDSTAPSDPGAR